MSENDAPTLSHEEEDWEDTGEDEDEFEVGLRGSKLAWAAIALVAVVTVIGAWALWGAYSRSKAQGTPVASVAGGAELGGGNPSSPGDGAAAGPQEPQAGPAVQDQQAPPPAGQGPPPEEEKAATALGQPFGKPPTESVHGEKALARVAVFIEANGLDKETGDSLTKLMEASEAIISEAAKRKEAGEIGEDAFVSQRDQEVERRRLDISQLLGLKLAPQLDQALAVSN
jgi:hypothetical protein